MWEHGGCIWSVQQDPVAQCGLLECNYFGACEMWARVEGCGTISMNAKGRCAPRSCHLCNSPVHGDLELGECLVKQVLEREPGNAGGYVLLSNIYAAAGKWGSQ